MKDFGNAESWMSGFRSLDNDHRLQVDLLVALRDAITGHRRRSEIDDILEKIVDYSRVHFASEQLLMHLDAYPERERHAGDHERMLADLEALRSSWRTGEASLPVERIDALADRLVEHIDTADRLLGQHLMRQATGV